MVRIFFGKLHSSSLRTTKIEMQCSCLNRSVVRLQTDTFFFLSFKFEMYLTWHSLREEKKVTQPVDSRT